MFLDPHAMPMEMVAYSETRTAMFVELISKRIMKLALRAESGLEFLDQFA